ncbi:MAG: hypothetical protein ABJB11_12950 [Ferruginibacter sp.]
MMTLEKYLEDSQDLYDNFILKREENELKAEEIIFRINTKENEVFFWYDLHQYFDVYMNDQIELKLNKLNLPTGVRRWFIPLKKIDEQFNVIQSHDILIDKFAILELIRHHIAIKVRYEMLMEKNATVNDNGKIKTGLTKYVENVASRRKYGNGILKNDNTVKKFTENLLNILAIEIEISTRAKFGLQHLNQLSKGNTESFFLKNILENDYFFYNKNLMSETKFLSSIYDFFKVIMPDCNFPTEEEFYRNPNVSEKNYSVFKAKKLKGLILKKKI